MGSALLRRLAAHPASPPLVMVEPRFNRRRALQKELQKLQKSHPGESFLPQCWGRLDEVKWPSLAHLPRSILLLAVKPQDFNTVGEAIVAITDHKEKVAGIFSIMAGISIARIQQHTAIQQVARAMPNIAAQYAAAVVGLSFSEDSSAQFQAQCRSIALQLGNLYDLPEPALHALTALSGSGIAFVLQFIHQLTAEGIQQGLAKKQIQQMVMETLQGALILLERQSLSPQEWIARICSPGGTTIAGLEALKKGGFDRAVVDALRAAAQRSQELER